MIIRNCYDVESESLGLDKTQPHNQISQLNGSTNERLNKEKGVFP